MATFQHTTIRALAVMNWHLFLHDIILRFSLLTHYTSSISLTKFVSYSKHMNKQISRGIPDFKKIPISFVAIHLKLTFCEPHEGPGKVSHLIQLTVIQFLHSAFNCEQTQYNIETFSVFCISCLPLQNLMQIVQHGGTKLLWHNSIKHATVILK
jgi:hypothetical protein